MRAKLLESFSTQQLRQMAKQHQLAGYSKVKKADLVELLTARWLYTKQNASLSLAQSPDYQARS
ncbi:Rho termination factor N-terminal domain-containing protein [Halomicronema hongdechloris]|uniref:Rho termination factor N-terminal domain-containing protein n=1 Tax=Halomicronema hongdechloris TaxID=1209493 RepID=UPI0010CBA9FE